MTVDLTPQPDGRLHFSLGPIEKWIAVVIAGAVVSVGVWNVRSVQTLLTQQAVTNSQLSNIAGQMGDVQTVRNDVTELKVRMSNIEDRTRELEQTRRAR